MCTVYPVPSSEDRSLQSVGRLGHSETSSLISAEDNVTKPRKAHHDDAVLCGYDVRYPSFPVFR